MLRSSALCSIYSISSLFSLLSSSSELKVQLLAQIEIDPPPNRKSANVARTQFGPRPHARPVLGLRLEPNLPESANYIGDESI